MSQDVIIDEWDN